MSNPFRYFNSSSEVIRLDGAGGGAGPLPAAAAAASGDGGTRPRLGGSGRRLAPRASAAARFRPGRSAS